MKYFALCMFALCSITLVGCVTTKSDKALLIKEVASADQEKVASCEFLTDLKAGSMHGGYLGRETGLEDSKNSVLNQAAEIGATHVLWQQVGGTFLPEGKAKAYRCP